MLDLKAELYKKEEEFKKQKAAAAGQAITSVAKKVIKVSYFSWSTLISYQKLK